MLMLLSPAKNLNFDPATTNLPAEKPAFSKDTNELLQVAKALTRADLAQMMSISDKLADLNFERFQNFKTRTKAEDVKPAALAFNGDVYWGLEAKTLTDEDLNFAQGHLRILSGLYGLLRPLDGIQPYRLEMGTRLRTERGQTLYDFWGDKLAKALNTTLKSHEDPTIINLASNEYMGAVDADALKAPVINVSFKELKDGRARAMMFYFKRARGMMARFAIQNRITKAEDLKAFSLGGYTFQKDASSDSDWLFTRPQPAKKAA